MKTIVVRTDQDPPNPRVDHDNWGIMFCRHGRYALGDKDAEDPDEAMRDDPYRVALCLPIYMYDHSGLTISHGPFSCPWDSGQLGWHYMTTEVLAKEFGGDVEKAKACLEAELQTYDFFLRGECWGFEVTNEDGEVGDCCYGYFGDTLEATGMQVDVEKDLQEALVEAWDRRFER